MASKRSRVSQAAAEEAVRTLLAWAGENPKREGLVDTPKRVEDAYRVWFSGYAIDPREYLSRTFYCRWMMNTLSTDHRAGRLPLFTAIYFLLDKRPLLYYK